VVSLVITRARASTWCRDERSSRRTPVSCGLEAGRMQEVDAGRSLRRGIVDRSAESSGANDACKETIRPSAPASVSGHLKPGVSPITKHPVPVLATICMHYQSRIFTSSTLPSFYFASLSRFNSTVIRRCAKRRICHLSRSAATPHHPTNPTEASPFVYRLPLTRSWSPRGDCVASHEPKPYPRRLTSQTRLRIALSPRP
jgi:hypothetical protein